MKEKEFLPLLKERLNIKELNKMQRRMLDTASEKQDIILLSPTGSGKTVAFILPVLKRLNPPTGKVQVVVIVPSRELVMQIAKVVNTLAEGYKVTALYGGHKVEDEMNSLKITPDIVVATPGRLLDHINRRNIDVLPTRILVLDEFDKTLELGFETELKKIIGRLKNVSRYILTSATSATLPEFLKLDNPLELDFLGDNRKLRKRLMVNKVQSDGRDKLEVLLQLLNNITGDGRPERSIIFVNHRESADRVVGWLLKKGVSCSVYHGALEQKEREMALALFNNGSRPILVATDLAARGLDIEGVKHVIHYHQPLTAETYTHRNGRTARVEKEGDVYVLIGPDEDIKDYVDFNHEMHLDSEKKADLSSGMETLHISAGKKEKLSKGDILGFLSKECGIPGSEIGKIEVFDHYSVVAVPTVFVENVLEISKSAKIKGEKQRFTKLR